MWSRAIYKLEVWDLNVPKRSLTLIIEQFGLVIVEAIF